jgi:hypothetical protein
MLYYLLLLGSLLPGIGFSYLAGAYFWRLRWLRRYGRRATGRVLRSEVESTGRGGAYFTTVGFATASGEPMEVELALGLPFRSFRVGEPVTVYYDPARPRRCMVKSRVEPWGYLVLALAGVLVTSLMLWDVVTHH